MVATGAGSASATVSSDCIPWGEDQFTADERLLSGGLSGLTAMPMGAFGQLQTKENPPMRVSIGLL